VKTRVACPSLSVLSLSLLAEKLGAEQPGAVKGAPGHGTSTRQPPERLFSRNPFFFLKPVSPLTGPERLPRQWARAKQVFSPSCGGSLRVSTWSFLASAEAPGWGAAKRTHDSEDHSATLGQEGKAPWDRRKGRPSRKGGHSFGRGTMPSSFLGHPSAKFSCRNARFQPESQLVKKTGDFGSSQTPTRPADKTVLVPVRRWVGFGVTDSRWADSAGARGWCTNADRKSSFPEVNR
jgi:hypothetical protein